MLQQLGILDTLVLIALLLLLPVCSLLAMKKSNSEDYFLAGRSLRWWAVAGSVFGTNINASHLIGMLGIGYSVGFAQSHYELLAVPAILILCYVFLPTYRKLRVFTLSQYLEHRYNSHARLVYSILMILLILVQLVAAFYIGSRTLLFLFRGTGFALEYWQGIAMIGLMSCSYTMFGGMNSVVIADTMQTVMMLAAGLLVAYFTFSQPEIGGFFGLLDLEKQQVLSEQRMHLYLPANHPDLPWSGAFTGLIVLHFFYWTTNQYLVQRVLAAKTDTDAKIGIIASGFLKLMIPFFSVACGVAAGYLFKIRLAGITVLPDDAFLHLVQTVVPTGYGLTGLILAGLTAATFSSVDSMMNSVSTLLTLDVYQKYLNPQASERQMIRFGRLAVLGMVALSAVLALLTYDPASAGNFFLSVSSRGSYFTQGVVAAFFVGIVWRKANPKAAVVTMLAAPVFAFAVEYFYNNFLGGSPAVQNLFGAKLNFLHRVFLTMVFAVLLHIGLSRLWRSASENTGELILSTAPVWLLRQAGLFAGIQFFLLLPVWLGWLLPAQVAAAAGLLSLGLFVWHIRLGPGFSGWRHCLRDDRLYAGILTGVTVFLLYYFV